MYTRGYFISRYLPGSHIRWYAFNRDMGHVITFLYIWFKGKPFIFILKIHIQKPPSGDPERCVKYGYSLRLWKEGAALHSDSYPQLRPLLDKVHLSISLGSVCSPSRAPSATYYRPFFRAYSMRAKAKKEWNLPASCLFIPVQDLQHKYVDCL